MIEGLVTGKLHGKPVKRADQNGRPYVIAKVLAPTSEVDTVIVNVITFDIHVGEDLLDMDEGDTLSLTGSLTPKVWTDRDGMVRAALDMVARRMLSVTSRA